MPDPSSFLAQAERLADRFRSMPQSRLTQFAPLGLRLARRLADRSLHLEGLPSRELPDVGVFAVGDQIALAAHDLATALAAVDGPPRPGPSGADPDGCPEADPDLDPEADPDPEAVLAEAVGLVAELAQRLATTRSARM